MDRVAVLTAGLVGSVALLAVVAAWARARTGLAPHAGPEQMDLGPETPALVDLLTDHFEVTPEAPVATLVDLAARGWIAIEEPSPGTVIVRLEDGHGRGELTPYEKRVLARVRKVAEDGVAIAGALAVGRDGQARGWWRQFRDEVIADARERGFCERRWTAGMSFLAVAASGVAFLALMLAGDAPEDNTFTLEDALAMAVIGAVILGITVASALQASRAVRATPAGNEVAARWLGVRRFLADHGQFDAVPAAGVAIWGPYLGHAVALDLAPMVVRQLPLGAESDRFAWSRRTGRWRLVHINYPRRRVGWGTRPAFAIFTGIVFALLAAWVATKIGGFAADLGDDTAPIGISQTFVDWSARIAWALTAGAVAVTLAMVVRFARGVLDLFRPAIVVDGVVLRVRDTITAWSAPMSAFGPLDALRDRRARDWRFVAVDDGTTDHVRAWQLKKTVLGSIDQGDEVRATVTRACGYVRSVERAAVGGEQVDAPAANSGARENAASEARDALAADPDARRLRDAAAALTADGTTG